MTDILETDQKVSTKVLWTIKESQHGLWVPVVEKHNIITSYGLTAHASAPAGVYVPPNFLVIEQSYTTLAFSYLAGVGSIQLVNDPTVGGDTKLDLSVGQVGQETVTFSAKTGIGPYVFTLVGITANAHTLGDFAVRSVNLTDTMTNVLSEAQFDSVYFPGLRLPITASYSPSTGQNTMQFFIAGIQATNVYFAHIGLADAQAIGTGNLHNYASFGYNHNNTNDIEIDVNYAMTTS